MHSINFNFQNQHFTPINPTTDTPLLTQYISTPEVSTFQGHSVTPLYVGLEQRLSTSCLHDVNIYAPVPFKDFLSPNEWNCSAILPHISKAKAPGVIVSTGTKRCFSDLEMLLKVAPEKCHGLVARDINPRAKAYVDFITLLFKISKNREEFAQFFSKELIQKLQHDFTPFCSAEKLDTDRLYAFKKSLLATQEGKQLIDHLRTNITESMMSEETKTYYLSHLEDFVALFYSTDLTWLELPGLEGFECLHDDNLFLQIQQLAKSGNIIATVGDITDLRFLNEESVHTVDLSNIPSYIRIYMQMNPHSTPNIIWCHTPVKQQFPESTYKAYRGTVESCPYEDILLEKFSYLCARLVESERISEKDKEARALQLATGKKTTTIHPVKGPTPQAMQALEEYCAAHMVHTDALGWLCFDQQQLECLNRLNTAPKETLRSLAAQPDIQRHVSTLVKANDILTIDNFLTFSSIPGWEEAFFSEVIEDAGNLLGFDTSTCLFAILHAYLSRHPEARSRLKMSEDDLQEYYQKNITEIHRMQSPEARRGCIPAYLERVSRAEEYLRDHPSFTNKSLYFQEVT